MCNPIAMVAVSAIGTAFSMYQGNQQAEAGAEAARLAAEADMGLLGEQAKQVNASASMDTLERQRQAQREQSKILVAAGESGGLGNSTLRMLHNSMLQEGHDTGIIETNRSNAISQTDAQARGTAAQFQSRHNEAMSTYTNPLMAGLQIGTGAASDYMSAKSQYSKKISK